MKKLNLLTLILATILFSGVVVNAQSEPETDSPDLPRMQEPVRDKGLLRELGLSQDQIRQIRMLNARQKPIMQEAVVRQRMAGRDLDLAIYAELLDETLIQERLKEVQLAQADIAKIRAINELEVRKILTADQLAKFKQLRQMMINRVNDRRQNRVQKDPELRRPNDNQPNTIDKRTKPR